MSGTAFLDGRVTLFVGDVREQLATMEADSVDCVVTSPPYWGLRDYGTAHWEGGDPNCQHERVDTERTAWANSVKGPGNTGKNGSTYANMTKEVGGRCAKCDARWADRQIGLEPTLAEHLSVMVDVFEAVKRVLKPTGTLWINYGDCYATNPNGRSAADTKAAGNDDRTFRDKPFSTVGPIYDPNWRSPETMAKRSGRKSNGDAHRANDGVPSVGKVVAGGYLKPKDLVMIPNRLAIALQDAGWWVRSEIIPDSSGAQRPSTSHEKIFLLTKSADADVWRARDTGEMSFAPDLSERCALITDDSRDGARWLRIGSYYDAEAVRQAGSSNSHGGTPNQGGQKQAALGQQVGGRLGIPARKVKMPDGWDTGAGGHGSHHRNGREKKGKNIDKQRGHSRRHAGFNDRWDDMEKAEQQANGRYLRNYEPAPLSVWEMATQAYSDAHFATFPPELAERCILAGCPKGGLVLDPFGGAGTTALVALRHHRRAALIELNPAYASMAQARIEAEWRVQPKAKPVDFGPLFGARPVQEAAE